MVDQTRTSGQAVARTDGKFPDVSVAAGHKGFKAELDGLRYRMRGLGFHYDEIAAEIGRRYRTRPRDTYPAGAWLRRMARDPGVSPWLLLDQLTAPDTCLSGLRSRPLGGAGRAWYQPAAPDGGGLDDRRVRGDFMHGTTSTATTRDASADGHARHAGTAYGPVAPLVPGGPRARPAGAAVRIPPFAARQEGSPVDQWPLQSFLELGALPGAVPCARLHTRHVLWEWGLASLADSTELLVSEMITNAVQASRAMAQAAVRLWLVSDQAQVMVLAWDASPLPPERADPGEDAENGRGLLLVDAISEQWGWYFPGEHAGASARDQHGKVVWAVVRLSTRTAA